MRRQPKPLDPVLIIPHLIPVSTHQKEDYILALSKYLRSARNQETEPLVGLKGACIEDNLFPIERIRGFELLNIFFCDRFRMVFAGHIFDHHPWYVTIKFLDMLFQGR